MALKVGYLGPEGTFCEEASNLYCKKLKNAELIPYATIHDLLIAVNKGKLDEGVTPIENSVEGTIGVVTDMLVKDVNLNIYEEIVLPIRHCLIAKKGTTLNDITDVISHPQAIDQCKDWLRKHLPKIQLHLAYSTADAVKQVATSIETGILSNLGGKGLKRVFAAIGTKASTKLYKLNIVAENINDYADNTTRFVVLSKKDHAKTGDDKTSIVFTIARDRPGGLYNILGEFAVRNINLTKIESRPSKKALGDYFFFIDMQGHRMDKKVAQALKEIKRKVAFLKILGSYPRVK